MTDIYSSVPPFQGLQEASRSNITMPPCLEEVVILLGEDLVEIPFPGNEAAYNVLSTPVFARTIGRFSIYASRHPETCGGGRLFNVADRTEPSSFKGKR
ncbi:hypothetical protein F5X99DRAFT_174534 [Biscogniauxia marginata]|nr:hypothetical protein F5X99DRAFT_174534 [Biscogniauxia marginata]